MEGTTLDLQQRETLRVLATVLQASVKLAVISGAPVDCPMVTLTAQCNQGPEDAPIDLVVGPKGDLIYRCRHNPCHDWELDGTAMI